MVFYWRKRWKEIWIYEAFQCDRSLWSTNLRMKKYAIERMENGAYVIYSTNSIQFLYCFGKEILDFHDISSSSGLAF